MLRALLVVALMACSSKHRDPAPPPAAVTAPAAPRVAGAPVETGHVRNPKASIAFAVIARAGTDLAALDKLARQQASAARLVDGTGGLEIRIRPLTTRDAGWNREHAERLPGKIPAADFDALDASPGAIGIGIQTDAANALDVLARAAKVAHALADEAHGWAEDADTRVLYRAADLPDYAALTTRPLDVRTLIVLNAVSASNQGDLPLLYTDGMNRLGLPELYLRDVPAANFAVVGTMLNATAQILVDRGDVSAPGKLAVDLANLDARWHRDEVIQSGGTGRVEWSARWSLGPDADRPTKPEDADFMIELVAAGGGSEGVVSAMNAFAGTPTDQTTTYRGDDPELVAAGVRARKELRAMRAHFAHGVPTGERLSIKAPFHADDDSIEWMWVDVSSWQGETLGGTLNSTPELVTTIHEGSVVSVKLDDLADFVLHKGTTETGGYSIEVARKRGKVR